MNQTFDEQLKRALDSIVERLHTNLTEQVGATADLLTGAAAAERLAAVSEATAAKEVEVSTRLQDGFRAEAERIREAARAEWFEAGVRQAKAEALAAQEARDVEARAALEAREAELRRSLESREADLRQTLALREAELQQALETSQAEARTVIDALTRREAELQSALVTRQTETEAVLAKLAAHEEDAQRSLAAVESRAAEARQTLEAKLAEAALAIAARDAEVKRTISAHAVELQQALAARDAEMQATLAARKADAQKALESHNAEMQKALESRDAEARRVQAARDNEARLALEAASRASEQAIADARAEALADSEARLRRMLDSMRSLDGASSLTHALNGLSAAASPEVDRQALFLVRGDTLRVWSHAGFESMQDGGAPSELGLTQSGVLADAVRHGTAQCIAGADSRRPSFAGPASAGSFVAVPVSLNGQVIGVLCGEQVSSPDEGKRLTAVFEVLARHVGRVLESLTALRLANVSAQTAAPH